MVLKKGDDYLKSMKSLRLTAHVLGEKPGDLPEHGLVEPSQKIDKVKTFLDIK